MKTKTDISYGVIPVRHTAAGIEVLLIHQHSQIHNDTYWTFPKGHSEGAESPQETAARELREETGLTIHTFLSEQLFTNQYSFAVSGERVQKTAAFFIAEVAPGALRLQAAEVRAARWLPVDQVLDQLEYDATKAMWQEVHQFLQT